MSFYGRDRDGRSLRRPLVSDRPNDDSPWPLIAVQGLLCFQAPHDPWGYVRCPAPWHVEDPGHFLRIRHAQRRSHGWGHWPALRIKTPCKPPWAGYGPSQVQAELDPNVPLYPNSTVRLSHVAPNRGGVGTPFREIGQMVTSWVIPPYPVPGQGDDCGPISRAERGRLGPDFSTRMFFNYQRRTSL